jgi:hypothetical protein
VISFNDDGSCNLHYTAEEIDEDCDDIDCTIGNEIDWSSPEFGLFADTTSMEPMFENYCEWAINFESEDKRLYIDWHLAKPVYLLQEKSMDDQV